MGSLLPTSKMTVCHLLLQLLQDYRRCLKMQGMVQLQGTHDAKCIIFAGYRKYKEWKVHDCMC